jgi:polynucleotide 5'-hydroxyl-kinase GRC3/NOL9
MIDHSEIDVPEAWRSLEVASWQEPVLIVGASNTGKSTFARYAYHRLLEAHDRVAFLDTDVGQNSYRLPTTLVAARNEKPGNTTFPPRGGRRVWFVGSNAPPGHLLRVVLGITRLTQNREAEALVVDTSGFISPNYGGANLKWTLVEILRPCTVVAFQREDELQPLLLPLHPLPGVRVVELPVPGAVRERRKEERRAYRARCYRDYFEDAGSISLNYHGVAVFPRRRFRRERLVALEGRDGFVLALALIEGADADVIRLRTPLAPSQKEEVAALQLGDLRIDLGSYQDEYV